MARKQAAAGHGRFGGLNQGAEYTDQERQFMAWLDRYKRARRKPFPTCKDVLAVIHALGYRQVCPPDDRLPE